MKMNVYNIIWADDEIDDILDDITISELKDDGFKVVGIAHDGHELETLLKNQDKVDAVIVDANFNESLDDVNNERDTSGLNYARSLYLHTLRKKIPFFLYTNRSDELLKEIYKDNPTFLNDFPRYERWFNKSGKDERKDMFTKIKETIDEQKSDSFIIRNKYQYELNAAFLLEEDEYVLDFLIKDYNGKLTEIDEPYITIRRIIEKIFGHCQNMNIIPPIDDVNGVAYYLLNGKYGIKDNSGKYIDTYKNIGSDIMPKPLAFSLKYIVDITQDAAHSRNNLKLDVHKYFKETKDVLMLRAAFFILMDVIKWFACTVSKHNDAEKNALTLWEEV